MSDLVSVASPDAGPRELELLEVIKHLSRIVRQGWRVIGISILICVSVAIIYLVTAKRVYQAAAQLLIQQQGGRPLNVANTDPSRPLEGAEDYIPTHAVILSSPMVVKGAIDRIGLERLPSLQAAQQAGRDPVEDAIN